MSIFSSERLTQIMEGFLYLSISNEQHASSDLNIYVKPATKGLSLVFAHGPLSQSVWFTDGDVKIILSYILHIGHSGFVDLLDS